MGQDALDHRRIDDGGDDLQLAATGALFEVDGEDALEQALSHRDAERIVGPVGHTSDNMNDDVGCQLRCLVSIMFLNSPGLIPAD